MAEHEVLVVNPSITKQQISHRGPIRARAINLTLEGAHESIHEIADTVNRLVASRQNEIKVLIQEVLTLRHDVSELKERQTLVDEFVADDGGTLYHVTTFKDLKNFDWTKFNEERRLRLDPIYGQATTPFNNYRSNFHYVDPKTSTIFLPKTVAPFVTEINEHGGTVTKGTPRNAFNGQNESYWQRSVAFPLSSDVEAVEVQLDVSVPIQFASKSNLFSIRPFPEGLVDVTSLQYSTDATDPTVTVPGFPSAGENAAKALRYHFAPTLMTKLRIKLRQRHWVEENGMKVFHYGLQELDLGLVELDKTDDPSLLNNNAVVWIVDTPAGKTYNRITNFFSDPDWDVLGTPTGVFYQIYTDAALTNKIWDSYTDQHPNTSSAAVPSSISRLYIVVALKYQTTSEKSPVLEKAGLSYTVN